MTWASSTRTFRCFPRLPDFASRAVFVWESGLATEAASDEAGGPSRLKIEAAGDAVHIEDLAGEVQAGHDPAFHRVEVDLAEPVMLLKAQLETLTNVPAEEQKLNNKKGKTINDDDNLQDMIKAVRILNEHALLVRPP